MLVSRGILTQTDNGQRTMRTRKDRPALSQGMYTEILDYMRKLCAEGDTEAQAIMQRYRDLRLLVGRKANAKVSREPRAGADDAGKAARLQSRILQP